jgi:hypothetical protein
VGNKPTTSKIRVSKYISRRLRRFSQIKGLKWLIHLRSSAQSAGNKSQKIIFKTASERSMRIDKI